MSQALNLKDYAQSRNVLPGTVSAYMHKHWDIYKKLVNKNGKQLELTPKAIELLNMKYTIPDEVFNGVPIEDYRELQKTLYDTQKALTEALNMVKDSQAQLADYHAVKARLEMHEAIVKELDQERNSYKKTIFGLYKKIED